MNTVCCEVWGAPKCSGGGNAFRPEGGIEALQPFCNFAIYNLVYDLPKIPVLSFNWSICLRIVAGDADVVDSVLSAEVINGGDVWCSVVSYEFRYSSISA